MSLLPRTLRRSRRDGARRGGIAISPVSWGISEMRGWGLQLDADRVLREIASLGVSAIEAGPSGFLPDRSEAARNLVKLHRLSVVAGPVRAVLHNHDLRQQELAHVDGHAAWLAALGADTLVLTLIGSRSDGDADVALSSSGWAHLLNAIGSVQHVCTNRRLRLAVLPRHGGVIRGPADLEKLLVGSEVGVGIDLGQLAIAGADAVEVIELAAGRIDHVRVSDVDGGLASQVRSGAVDYAGAVARGLFRPVGRGDAGVAAAIEALQSGGYRGWYGIELETRLRNASEDPLASVRASLETVQTMLPAAQGRR